MTLPGIDISEHQMTTPDLTGLAFVIVRASIGLQADRMYATHAARVQTAGGVLGAYHYNWGAIGPLAQADFFLAQAVGARLLALDVEGAEGFTPAQAQAFVARIHAQGRKIGLYHSASGFPSVGQDWDWVASWGLRPTRPWTFWQWQGSPLDSNYYNGDAAAFAAFVAGQEATDMQLDPSISTTYMADFTPGATVYRDAARTIVFDASWAGGAGIGVVGIDDVNTPGFAARNVCINLYEPTPPNARALVYVGADHMQNLRPRHPLPGTYTQAELDVAATNARKNGYNAGRGAVLDAAGKVPPV